MVVHLLGPTKTVVFWYQIYRATRKLETAFRVDEGHLGGGFHSNYFCGIFTPKIGEDEPILTRIFFQMGGKKPPTSHDLTSFAIMLTFDAGILHFSKISP